MQVRKFGPLMCLLLSFVFGNEASGQEPTFQRRGQGISGGLNFNWGTHVRRCGVFLSGYYFMDGWQGNAVARYYFNFKGLGPPGHGSEGQVSLGVVYAFDDHTYYQNSFPGVVTSQTGRKYSVGYGYNFYWDSRGLSQRTGTIGFQFGNIDFVHENDALGAHSDRYRTAALLLAYRSGNNKVGLNSTLWHGNANSDSVIRVDDHTFARYGYKDLSAAEQGRYSHGLLSAQYEHAFSYGQLGRVNIGIDDERVRNVVQNKFFHDMYLWPERWNKARNPHIPMLDDNGNPFTYAPGQQLRKTRWYSNVALNSPNFY